VTQSGQARAVNWAFQANPVFAYEADYAVPIAINAAPANFQSAQFQRVTGSFQAVLAESGRPLFGRLFGYNPRREALALQVAGLKVALVWHGSDIRLPSHHLASHPLSPYGLPQLRARAAELESTARRNRRLMWPTGLPQLVSTPDLLDQVPGAIWCPVVVRALASPAGPILDRPVPRVVHIPSNPLLKGTDLIDPVLRRLERAGRIEYLRAEGLPASEVGRLYASADIVADQFRLGIYGVAAAEAMAAGRLVLSDADQAVQDAVRRLSGLGLPIVRTSAQDLEITLERIMTNPEPFRALAASGPGFVEAVHSGRCSAEAILEACGLAGRTTS
jgi:hypothetical protein